MGIKRETVGGAPGGKEGKREKKRKKKNKKEKERIKRKEGTVATVAAWLSYFISQSSTNKK